ncbi:MAG: L,D-transpeptidase, partial [Acidobacteriota bacterium]|nr:L,D-transpeptidase [Acidobacteriota bacterium]
MNSSELNFIRYAAILLTFISLLLTGCVQDGATNSNSSNTGSPSPSASPSVSPTAMSSTVPVTLPVLDALFSDEAFKTKLKTQVELTDDQVAQLQKISGEEVARLREANIEAQTADSALQVDESRQRASEAIRNVVGEQKAEKLFTFVRDYWVKGGEEGGTTAESSAPAGPNAVPKDTRVVVNIPAYRMDVFREGSLVKSYKIGIGYPDFPLPTGLRKAQTIIFNPTWTPPDEPWVAKMKGVAVGEKVAAGSKLNPLGPIKIPIGLPSLI